MTSFKKKAILGLVACLALAAILLIVAFLPMDSSRSEAVRNRTDQLKREAFYRRTPREVLRGNPIPGNAWEEYNIALSAPWPKDAGNGSVFYMFGTGTPGVDGERVKQMVAEQQPLLEHLRLGSQRPEGQYPYKWKKGEETPSLLGSRMLANLAIAQARILTEAGKPQEAADVLLDAIVFARNTATNGPEFTNFTGMAIYVNAFEGVRRLILSGKLSEKQLAELAKKLEAVERDFPPPSSMLSYEILNAGNRALASSGWKYSEQWKARAEAGGWRYAAFPATTLLEAFEQSDAFIQRFKKTDQMSFAAAREEVHAISFEAMKSPNLIIRESMSDLSQILLTHRETLTTLRLVRAATLFLATGKMQAIPDPFGTNLFFKQEGGSMKIWSIGSNSRGVFVDMRPIVLEIPK
jgi:hypothetical protein